MLIQVTTPRVLINLLDSPEHIRIHTLRRPGTSSGEVFFNAASDPEHGKRMTVPLEPYDVLPIEGFEGFEVLEYYLPFDTLYGTKKRAEYDEARILASLNKPPKQVHVDQKSDHLTDLQLSRIGASGFFGIAKSAYRSENSKYEERIFNFSLNFPVTGGGILRIANVDHDFVNSTFNPRAHTPKKNGPNEDLLIAYNRTHKPMDSGAEARRRQRIQEAEANVRANTRGLPPPPETPRVEFSPPTVREIPLLKTDLDDDEES